MKISATQPWLTRAAPSDIMVRGLTVSKSCAVIGKASVAVELSRKVANGQSRPISH